MVPRVALTETDRELGFTIVRTGTDFSRALSDHADILARAFPAATTPLPPPVPPTPTRRTRRMLP
ncbi:MAG: hypothetical protein INR63_31815 [Actinomycetospora chiangmaiensis]|nr:hypothetical protein [Actinomycetospora chiangmaiensis]